ncbi:MAG: hypothetical protein GYB68_16630 [Chloroflexi bacterium]|nr:hypothetical protein [Chloroflexota bacterium]
MSDSVIWGIRTYKLFLYAGTYEVYDHRVKGLIILNEAGGEREVYAYFTDGPPPEGLRIVNERYIVWYEFDQFHPLMEMLREEKPIYIQYFEGDRKYLTIATAAEPVGEGEDK